MKIGIDARFVGPQGTGLGKYCEKLVLNLQRIDKKNQYKIFLRKDNWNYLTLESENFQKILADVAWYSLSEQLRMPGIFSSQKLDLLHVPHFNAPIFYKGKFIVTIHDLIHHHFSETSATTKNPLLYKIKRLGYTKVIKNAVEKSVKIITPSEFTKGELIKTFNVSASKIAVTYEAAEEEYKKGQKSKAEGQKLLKKYKIKTPFIIYVGNAYPHKNLENLLKVVKTLNEEYLPEINLVIVSSRDVFASRLMEKIDGLGLGDFVTLTGYIMATNLAQILRHASAYVFPSLAEGFGIPGLNAMAAGVPVVASNIPTLKEVYGPAALYFNPKDPDSMKVMIRKAVSDEKTREEQIKKGFERTRKYSWQKMAQETLAVYERTFKSQLAKK